MTPAVLPQSKRQRTAYRRADGNIRVGSETAVAIMAGVGDRSQMVRLNVHFTEKMFDGLGKIQEELKLRCC